MFITSHETFLLKKVGCKVFHAIFGYTAKWLENILDLNVLVIWEGRLNYMYGAKLKTMSTKQTCHARSRHQQPYENFFTERYFLSCCLISDMLFCYFTKILKKCISWNTILKNKIFYIDFCHTKIFVDIENTALKKINFKMKLFYFNFYMFMFYFFLRLNFIKKASLDNCANVI